ACRINRRHAYGAAHVALQRLKRQRKLLLASQDVAAEIVVNSSRIRKFDRALATVQKHRSQTTLHLLDVLGRSRLAHPAMFRTFAKASCGSSFFKKSLLQKNPQIKI